MIGTCPCGCHFLGASAGCPQCAANHVQQAPQGASLTGGSTVPMPSSGLQPPCVHFWILSCWELDNQGVCHATEATCPNCLTMKKLNGL